MTIVAIDGDPSGSGLVDEWPALYQSAQTEIDTVATRTIPCLGIEASRTWFILLRAAV